MDNDVVSNWVSKAKVASDVDVSDTDRPSGVKVIRRDEYKSKGNIIMEIADKIWPSLMKLFAGVHDENGLLMQPAHVRGIALNVAQDLIKTRENTQKKAEA